MVAGFNSAVSQALEQFQLDNTRRGHRAALGEYSGTAGGSGDQRSDNDPPRDSSTNNDNDSSNTKNDTAVIITNVEYPVEYPAPNPEPVPDGESAFAACLLVMDDNHRLPGTCLPYSIVREGKRATVDTVKHVSNISLPAVM